MSANRLYQRKNLDVNVLREAVKEVSSWRALALKLGMTYPSASIYSTVRPFCLRNGIDFGHFLGQASNRGKARPEYRNPIDLYLTNELRISSHALKLKLIEEGLKAHRCEVCNRTHWNEKPIPIQLHHLDGNSTNNVFENLQIICPNCHAQTSNYCSKNRATPKKKQRLVTNEELLALIPQCENPAQVLREIGLSLSQNHYNRIKKLIVENSGISFRPLTGIEPLKNQNPDPNWRHRKRPETRKYIRPSPEELNRMVWEKSSSALAKDLGICDTLLCDWCREAGVAKPPRGYWSRRASGETHEEAIAPYVPPKKNANETFFR